MPRLNLPFLVLMSLSFIVFFAAWSIKVKYISAAVFVFSLLAFIVAYRNTVGRGEEENKKTA